MSADERFYLDTSALLPYYREEPASEAVERLLGSLRPPVMVSDLTRVEFFSAVARWVRMGELEEWHADTLGNAFEKDIAAGLLSVREVKPSHFRQAERWLSRRRTALRTLDALHLACCWGYGARLITCDTRMHRAAELAGIGSVLVGPAA